MVPGEIIAFIILRTVALVEGVLANWVNVTNVSGNITPSLLPHGETFIGYLSDLVEATMSLMANVVSYLS